MRILGKTGISVNEIGFGGIPIQNVSKEEAKELFREMDGEKYVRINASLHIYKCDSINNYDSCIDTRK